MNWRLPPRGRRLTVLAFFALAAGAACETSSEVAAPSDLRPQAAPGMTTVNFCVVRADNLAATVAGATVSVYLTADGTPQWYQTGANGCVAVEIPNQSNIGYLARYLSPSWLNQLTAVFPVKTPPPAFAPPAFSDLDAVTCSATGQVTFSETALRDCVANRYVQVRGAEITLVLALPTLPAVQVTVKSPNGQPFTGTDPIFSYVVDEFTGGPFPWQNLLDNTSAGFLRAAYVASGNSVPGKVGAALEVYGTYSGGGNNLAPGTFDIAFTGALTGLNQTVTVAPVVCANVQDGIQYTESFPAPTGEFSFTSAKWAYLAKRPELPGSLDALVKNSNATAAVVWFSESGGPHVVEFTQRLRSAGGTNTISGSIQCTSGECVLASATYSAPGKANPLKAQIFHPGNGQLFFVVEGVGGGSTEWSAKASKVAGKAVTQVPLASKSTQSSAFFPFNPGFTFCDPAHSFDKGFGCDV